MRKKPLFATPGIIKGAVGTLSRTPQGIVVDKPANFAGITNNTLADDRARAYASNPNKSTEFQLKPTLALRQASRGELKAAKRMTRQFGRPMQGASKQARASLKRLG